MSGWTFFFILVGVVFLTSQLFRVIDAIERPPGGLTGGGQPCGEMDVLEKLTILTDAAKYDAACTSSGGNRKAKAGYIGNTTSSIAGCCHSFSADGRCVTLLKVLMILL